MVFYNNHVIQRVPVGNEIKEFKDSAVPKNITVVEDDYDIPAPNGHTFILTNHAIEKLEERFPTISTRDLHSYLGGIADHEWKFETYDSLTGEGEAKAYLEGLGMIVVGIDKRYKWIIKTVKYINQEDY